MKRILMLRGQDCASGDFTNGKIYDVLEDILIVYKDEIFEDGTIEHNGKTCEYAYTKENINKYSEYKQLHWISVKDNSSQDDFEVNEEDNRFIIFENDKELAHELINRIDGFATTIVNMAMYFRNQE